MRLACRQQNKRAEQDAQAAPQQAPPRAAAASAADPIQQLKELGKLHQSGVPTDEVFAVQKSRILNG